MEMGTEDGNPFTYLVKRFKAAPERFDFFQAVRLIQNAFLQRKRIEDRHLLGDEARLPESIVRFTSVQSLAFSASEISKIRPRLDTESIAGFEMSVLFMGLTGPNGVLPAHYTSLVIERCHTRNKDYALRDFLDLFNHRAISLFYQAWQKYRLPFAYEKNRLSHRKQDDVTTALLSLTGHGVRGLQNRSSFRDELLIYYGGLFASQSRNACGLEQLLSSFYQVRIEVEQFCERWIYLAAENQSCFPSRNRRLQGNVELGRTAVVGARVRDCQSLFRVLVGPMTWVQFLKLLPGMSQMESLVQLIHRYVGGDLDFEVQLRLSGERIPPMKFGLDHPNPMFLGQTTWLGRIEPGRVIGDVTFRFGFGGRPLNGS